MPQKEYTSGSVELEDPILEVEKPARFAVVFFNDDYTPMEFVVYVIQQFFGFDHAKATEVMLQIHTEGKGYCGAFSREVLDKIAANQSIAKQNEHPLKTDIEELIKD